MRPRAYLLLPLLIPLIGALLAANASAAPQHVEHLRIAGQRATLEVPARRTDRVVLYVHGAGETIDTVAADAHKAPIRARLLRDGYAFAATDAHGDNWGSLASIRDYLALVRHLRSQGFTRVYVLAQSMGGLDALQLIDRLHPVAWAALEPVCNLPGVMGDAVIASEVRSTYGTALPARLSPVRPSGVRGLRMLFVASPQDVRVPMAANTNVCARYARSRGARVRVVSVHGNHGDFSHFAPNRVVSFFEGR
jgi:pimeloyl-ACP methyl ester carboxylesterase